MRLVAESFAWPFRGEWRSKWAAGLLVVLVLPVSFIAVLGYAIAATRAAEEDPATGPPPWRPSARMLTDGFWTSLAILLTALPFAIAWNPLADLLLRAGAFRSTDSTQASLDVHVLALFILALPWGLLLLLLMPHATARFAASGRPRDLFDFAGALKGVVRDFAMWNVAVAAIVTAWAVGLACVGLLCLGLVPGVFYAILVSAHASAALHRQGENPLAG